MTSSSGGGKVFNSNHHGRRVEGGGFGYGDMIRKKNIGILHRNIALLAGTSNPALAEQVANILKIDLEQPITYFNGDTNGEMDVNIRTSLRGRPTFIMEAASPSSAASESNVFVELMMMLDAARKASSGERTVFCAPMLYQRKDRQDDMQKPDVGRQASGAKVVLNELERAGADRFQTVELHAMQELFFTDRPYDALFASRVLVPVVGNELLDPSNTVYLGPDYGGGERARKWNEFLNGAGSGYMQKRRTPEGITGYRILGDVMGRHVVIVDDVASTGNTLCTASKMAHEEGALSVSVAVAHGEFVNEPGKDTCLDKLVNAGVSRIFTTDTIGQREEILNRPDLVKVVPIAPLIAEAFRTIANEESIHKLV